MFAWIYFKDINWQVGRLTKESQVGAWGDQFREAESQGQRVNDLLKAMGWDVAPWWDFLGWVQSARFSAVTTVLNEAIETAKLETLSALAEKAKTTSKKVLLGTSNFRFYSEQDMDLVAAVGDQDLSKISSWAAFEKAAKSVVLGDAAEAVLKLEGMDPKALERAVRRAENGEDVSRVASLAQASLMHEMNLFDASLLSDRVFDALRRFRASSGFARTLAGALNRHSDVPALRREALALHLEDRDITDIRRSLLTKHTTATFKREETCAVLSVKSDETALSTELVSLAPQDKDLENLLGRIAYQTVEGIASRALYRWFSFLLIQAGKEDFEVRTVLFTRNANQVNVRYEYTAPFVLGDLLNKTSFGQCTSVHTYTIVKTKRGWTIADLQFEPLKVSVEPRKDAPIDMPQMDKSAPFVMNPETGLPVSVEVGDDMTAFWQQYAPGSKVAQGAAAASAREEDLLKSGNERRIKEAWDFLEVAPE